MIEWFYSTITALGYHHPLHPVLTHLPVGLVMGAFLFAVGALVLKRDAWWRTARHCLILALLTAPLAALAGWMDWRHFYNGTWITPIKFKLLLAPGLIVVLAVCGIFLSKSEQPKAAGVLLVALSLLTASGLGFFGGELVYGSRTAEASIDATALNDPAAQKGAELFAQNCSRCHKTDSTAFGLGPGLQGLFARGELPGSKKPVTEENIRKVFADPVLLMPAFPNLTDEEIDSLLAYLKKI
jgi:mono/diheme cytochrome c family protein